MPTMPAAYSNDDDDEDDLAAPREAGGIETEEFVDRIAPRQERQLRRLAVADFLTDADQLRIVAKAAQTVVERFDGLLAILRRDVNPHQMRAMPPFVRLQLDRFLAELGSLLAFSLDARQAKTIARQPVRHFVGRNLRVDRGQNAQRIRKITAIGCCDAGVQHLRNVERQICHRTRPNFTPTVKASDMLLLFSEGPR
jgi:hypothetical protein